MHHPWHQPSSRTTLLTPCTGWFKDYSYETFKADLTAGFVVAVVLIPQAMAYALLAGLPPVAGFYAALVGAVVASMWGSAPLLSTGPVALLSFLVFSALVPLAEPGSAEYLTLAAALAVLSGLILFALGIFRLGYIMRFIPHSVITGFASAAAVIIAVTQLPSLLGFVVTRHEFMLPSFADVVVNMMNLHTATAIIGISSLSALFILKRVMPHFPSALIVLLSSIGASYIFQFEQTGIAVLGSIPFSLPAPEFSVLTFATGLTLLSKAFVIAIVGFVSTYAIAQSFREKGKNFFDVDQELVGQGMGNIIVGIFKGFPVSGSFSRTAINREAGARSGMASIYTALIVLFSLFLIGPLLSFAPLATLSAIIIISIVEMIHIKKLRVMYHLSKTDGVVAIATFVTALILKPDDAVLIGVIVALALFIQQLVRVKVRILGLDTEWNILQGIETSGTVQMFPGALLVRTETSAFYGNIEVIIIKIDEYISTAETGGTSVKFLVLDCSSITYMDLSGAEQLLEYVRTLKEEGIGTYAIYVHPSLHGLLARLDALSDITPVHNIAELRKLLEKC